MLIPSQKTIALGLLKLADYNPRSMPDSEMRSLMTSLAEYGFVEPVVARVEDHLVIGGHQRLVAYRRLLAEQGKQAKDIDAAPVPVVLLDHLTDERAKLLNLALNRIHGEWDQSKLASVIDSLTDLTSDSDIARLSGFSMQEVDDLLASLEAIPPPSAAMPPAIGDAAAAAAARNDVSERGRRFRFEVATDRDAETCRKALARFGMKGQSSASGAFVLAMRAAVSRRRKPTAKQAAAPAAAKELTAAKEPTAVKEPAAAKA